MSQNVNKTMSLAVMSGKGGVGKTNLSLNLGFALNSAGNKVLLMDCDLGLANLDVMLGISPEKNLQDLLRPGMRPRDVVVNVEEGGLDVLPAASGVPELVEMDEDMQGVLFGKLMDLVGRYQYVILDLGAGISSTVLSFASMTQYRVVIVTPEPTSLTDSYALIKVLKTQHFVDDFHVVVNNVESQAEAKETFNRLSMACEKFLGVKVNSLGHVRHDAEVANAIRRQIPLLKHAPQCSAGKDILGLALKIQKMRQDQMTRIAGLPIMKNFPSLRAE